VKGVVTSRQHSALRSGRKKGREKNQERLSGAAGGRGGKGRPDVITGFIPPAGINVAGAFLNTAPCPYACEKNGKKEEKRKDGKACGNGSRGEYRLERRGEEWSRTVKKKTVVRATGSLERLSSRRKIRSAFSKKEKGERGV